MAINLVRAPSETPNISNVDDFCGLRYAYANINGFVKNKGNEINYEINGSILNIKSGRIVLQGVECDIDSNGVNITVDNVASKRYFTVYLKVDLNTNTAQILSEYKSSDYPVKTGGDNLTAETSGYAQLDIYHFTATGGIISEVEKLIKGIEFTSEQLDVLKNNLTDGTVVVKNATNATSSTYAQYASTDTTKGTIEQRLTSLGFRQATITNIDNPYFYLSSESVGYQQGTVVALSIKRDNIVQRPSSETTFNVAQINGISYSPSEDTIIGREFLGAVYQMGIYLEYYWTSDNKIKVKCYTSAGSFPIVENNAFMVLVENFSTEHPSTFNIDGE